MKYAIVGVGGYIAKKHLQAIKDTGGELVYAYDTNDSVGILDSYFIDCLFTTDLNQFKRYLKNGVDYLVICTPNHTHYQYIRLGLKYCREVICEKPIIIKQSHFNKLLPYSDRINCILQLRYSKHIDKIRDCIKMGSNIEVVYHARRGNWYHVSWKGDKRKSGGVLYNIGIHIIDLLTFVGANFEGVSLDLKVCNDIQRTIKIDNNIFNLSEDFTDLHTYSYKEIIRGNGFKLNSIKRTMDRIKKLVDI
jgi:UDP-N-acetyl-2-amino-2-deoxyglucuronate dehydrogenase